MQNPKYYFVFPETTDFSRCVVHKDNAGDVFYLVWGKEYFGVNYLIIGGCLVHTVTYVGTTFNFKSIQEIVNVGRPDIPETPIPAKKLTIEF